MGEVGVGDDDVGECLDIAQTVGKSGLSGAITESIGVLEGSTWWAARGGSNWLSQGGGTL